MTAYVDRARVGVAVAPGIGPLILGSPISGYMGFAQAGLTDGAVISYCIEDVNGSFEIGRGTFYAASNTMTRDSVLHSSATGNAHISASASAQAFVTILAEDINAGFGIVGYLCTIRQIKTALVTQGQFPTVQNAIPADLSTSVAIQWGNGGYLVTGDPVWTFIKSTLLYTTAQMLTLTNLAATGPE